MNVQGISLRRPLLPDVVASLDPEDVGETEVSCGCPLRLKKISGPHDLPPALGLWYTGSCRDQVSA
jgi:hypothetical protein